MKTYQPKQKELKRNWHLVDASGAVLGRMSSEIARLLMGKHKATYAPHLDMGDYVVVINAKEVVLTGRKTKQKVYRRHTMYPGGFREVKFEKMMEDHPERIIEKAVSGMLPKNRLRDKRLKRLRVFEGKLVKYQDKFKTD